MEVKAAYSTYAGVGRDVESTVLDMVKALLIPTVFDPMKSCGSHYEQSPLKNRLFRSRKNVKG